MRRTCYMSKFTLNGACKLTVIPPTLSSTRLIVLATPLLDPARLLSPNLPSSSSSNTANEGAFGENIVESCAVGRVEMMEDMNDAERERLCVVNLGDCMFRS